MPRKTNVITNKTYDNDPVAKRRKQKNDWQSNNQIVISCKLDKNTGQAFRDYATANNTTVSALVAGFVRSTLDDAGMSPDPKAPADPA